MFYKYLGLTLLSFFLLFFINCKKIFDPIYFESQQISGTEVYFPLGYYSGGSPAANPKISPNGHFIIYREFNPDPTYPWGLYLFNSNTSEKNLLFEGTTVYNPAWSPDGNWIVFNIDAQIYKIKLDGDSLIQLTTQGRNFHPSWSHNGKWITYDRSLTDSSGPQGIWIMKPNGSEKKWLGYGRHPTWYKSDDKILAAVNESQYWQLIEYNINDSHSTRLPFKNADIRDIHFSTQRDQITLWTPEGIWIMSAGANKPNKILSNTLFSSKSRSKNKLFVFAPSWHPDGKHIVYEHYLATQVERGLNGIISEGYFSIYMEKVD